MENILILKIIGIIIIYFVSIPLARLANKFAYIKSNASIIPISWYIPVMNSFLIIMLPLLTALLWLADMLDTSEYYKDKWER